MRFSVIPLLALVGSTAVAAETSPPAPVRSNVSTRSLPLVVDDLTKVASARLYVTADDGATWTLAEELVVVQGTTPRFTFTAPKDGTYGFASAVTFLDGNRESEPQPGTKPDLLLAIDTVPPTIQSFSAEPVERATGHLQLRLAWAIADEALGTEPVTIEVSLDGGSSFAPLKQGGASGNLLTPLAIPAGAKTAHLRLSAKDAAGNLAVSATSSLPLDVAVTPPPTGDTTALAEALAALPTLADPEAAPTESIPAAAPSTAKVIPPEVDVNRPDVVVPDQPKTESAPAPEIETVTTGGTDAELIEVTAIPAAGTAWQNQDRPAIGTGGTDPVTTPPEEAPAAAPKPQRDPLMPPGIPPAGRLSPAQANTLLASAREAANAGHLEVASARYRRLRDSHVGEGAIIEEVRLYRETGDPMKARSIIAGLRPGERTEPLLIEDARCLAALGRSEEAVTALAAIKANGPNAPEAFYTIAQIFRANGKEAEAKKLFAHVAKGTGPWAEAARAEVAR